MQMAMSLQNLASRARTNMQNSPLDSIVYIMLPDGFKVPENAFQIDVSIPLPVQKSDGTKDFDLETLSWEMILAGILTVLAYEHDNPHLLYYRSILKAVRPNIKKELTEAAILKAKNEDFDIAEEIFAALRGFDPDDMVTILNSALFFDERASSYRKSGLLDEADAYDDQAFSYYKQAMTAEPPIADSYFNAGFFFLKQKNYIRAKDVLETFLMLASATDEEKRNENETYKINRAKEIVAEISSHNLEDELFKSAYDFIMMGQEEKGMEQIRLFLEKNPKVWNAWFMLGWALRRLGRYADAKSAFLQTIECGGNTPDTYNELAICLLETGELDEAKNQLLKALSLEPDNTKVMSNLGFVALRAGDESEARRFFTAVLEFDPNDVMAKQALQNLEYGA